MCGKYKLLSTIDFKSILIYIMRVVLCSLQRGEEKKGSDVASFIALVNAISAEIK